MKKFPNIYTQRQQDPSWSVVQAATLLLEGKNRECASLVIYAALELRLAVEQLIFTVIAVGKGGPLDEPTLDDCKKKDGLFRALDRVAPRYSLRCRFSNVLASFYPQLPKIAEWDVRSLRRYYTDLSEFCHSQLIIRDFAGDRSGWEKKMAFIEEVYLFLASGMKKGTGVLEMKDVDPTLNDLWEKFSSGKITVEELRSRFALLKPVLEARKIHRPW